MQNVQGLSVIKLSCKRPQVQVPTFASSNISDESIVEELADGSEEKSKKNLLNYKIEFKFLE